MHIMVLKIKYVHCALMYSYNSTLIGKIKKGTLRLTKKNKSLRSLYNYIYIEPLFLEMNLTFWIQSPRHLSPQ